MKQRWQSQFPSRFMNINQIQINNEIHIFTTISCIFKSFFLPLQRKNRRIMTFDKIFCPLENSRISEMLLGKEKARIKERPQHADGFVDFLSEIQ